MCKKFFMVRYMDKIKLSGADGIRGFACLIVLLMHAVGFFIEGSGKYISGTGKLGVWLFFVLSAFLLTYKFYYSSFTYSNVINYLVGRFFRILPIFFICVYFYYYFGYFNFEKLKSLMLLETGYQHLWTIPVEFKFYFILPILAYFAIKLSETAKPYTVILVMGILILLHQSLFPYQFIKENSPLTEWYTPSFMIGICASVLICANKTEISNKLRDFIGFTILFLMVLSAPGARHVLFGTELAADLMNKYIYISLLWGVFVYLFITGHGIIGKIMQSKPLVLLGKWSFSIYLIHWFVYMEIRRSNPQEIKFVFISIIAAVISGAILYYVIESPIEKARHKIMSMRFLNFSLK